MLGKIVVLIMLASISSGRTDNPARLETGGVERIHDHLDATQAVLITTPKDGGYGDKTYRGSGAKVAQRIDASLSRYARLVDVTPQTYRDWLGLQQVILDKAPVMWWCRLWLTGNAMTGAGPTSPAASA